MNAEEKLPPEIQELLDNTPVLTEDTIREVAEANQALNRDPGHIAGIIKSVFVNEILCAMENQGLNKNQLAKKWGRKRQYLTGLLDKEKPRNFTVDTIVGLSMALGLRPKPIQFERMDELKAKDVLVRKSLSVLEGRLKESQWCSSSECQCGSYAADDGVPANGTGEKPENLEPLAGFCKKFYENADGNETE